ncbi:hypothetical protein L1987_15934 [Smallanthus sonchifolius]|uniref:Uncharacterized protein n=1 Tax=Smallanthus sonchifolius TaxID=185202 RepID=A0ACB9J946_9ASTR|nr:hypothetical protein L1987_15934 [Smallanthus sonchifolius]
MFDLISRIWITPNLNLIAGKICDRLAMTAGAVVVCNDVVRKVEIEEKCGVNAGVNSCDLDEVGVGNGGGKDDADDSSYVFVSGSVEVSAGDPDDTGGVNVGDFGLKSDSADEVDLLRKEEFGIESKGIVHGSTTVGDSEVEAVKDDVNLENGSAVDTSVVVEGNAIAQDVNGHLDKISGVEEAVVESTEEVDDGNEIPNVEIKMDDIGSGVVFDPESTLNTIESSPVTVTESDSTIHPSDVAITQSLSMPDVINTTEESFSTTYTVSNTDCEVMVSEGPESISNLIDKTESQVTVDVSGKPSEDLECQVTADGSESSGSSTKIQVTVDESGKPSEDLECQVTADGSESSGSPTKSQVTVDESGKPSEDLASQVVADESESFINSIKERECKVSVDGSDSIGSLVDNQECPVSVESKPSGNHNEEVDVKSEEHQELLVNTSEINVEAEPNYVCNGVKAEHQSVLVSVPCQSENNNAEGTDIGLSTESEENPDSGLVLSEDTDALANGQAEKFDGILEMGETQISGTEADRSVPLMLNAKKEKLEENLERQMEGSSESLLKVTESEIEVNSEDMKEQDKIEDEIQESQIVVTDNVQDDMNLEDNTTESANEAEVPLETETNIEPIIHVNTTSQYEVSNSIDKPQEGFPLEGSSETVDLVISECNNSELLVVKDNVSLSTADGLVVVVEPKAEIVAHLDTENRAAEDVECGTGIENVDVSGDNEKETEVKDASVEYAPHLVSENRAAEGMDCGTGVENVDVSDDEEKGTEVKDAPVESAPHLVIENISAEGMDCGTGVENDDFHDDEEKETEVKDASVEYALHLVTKNRAAEGMDCGTGVENVDVSDDEEKGTEVTDVPVESAPHLVIENISAEGVDCGTGVENVDFHDDEEKETEVKDAPVGGHSTLSFSDTIVNSGAVIEFGSIGRHETTHNIQNEEAEDIDGIQSDEIPTSSVEGSVIDAVDVQNEVAEVLAYNFLIKIPRCEDENLRDQIRSAQLLVDEKTRLRDAIRMEIQGKRARLKAHNEAYNAAKTDETAARRLVRLKRQEIDSVQVVINRWKNAMSVEDIDGRIFNMEHMIQHETLLLKDEKQFIREIKQLKNLRDQLASNMGSSEEIQQAIDQKDHNEERMKTLKKELDSLKDKASKAEAVVKAAGKSYDEESRRERELQAQFRAADDVRQKAYAHLNSLKKLSYDKNKSFRQFKEDLMAARDFASHGNKDALYRLCANQVETFMEQWNNNDEFRKEYVSKCNMNVSRRQRALDGGPLVPDDVAPALPGNMNEKVDNGPVSIPGEEKSVSVVLPVEEGKIVSSTEKKQTDNSNNINNRSIENVSGQKNQTLKIKGVAKPTALGSDDVAVVSELTVENKKEEENTLTKEDIELAKKAEELRKEEIAAKLKEQRRLEEKAKAIEALERKKRNAEKAQIRAELRARKEAEQKEKEREKRLRKKEKKKTGGGDGSINGEEVVAASSESANEAVAKDTETVPKNKKKSAPPPPHFFSKQLKPKPIPPPLVNRNKKRWQQWGKLALAVAGIFLLFLLGNTSYIRLKFNGLI